MLVTAAGPRRKQHWAWSQRPDADPCDAPAAGLPQGLAPCGKGGLLPGLRRVLRLAGLAAERTRHAAAAEKPPRPIHHRGACSAETEIDTERRQGHASHAFW